MVLVDLGVFLVYKFTKGNSLTLKVSKELPSVPHVYCFVNVWKLQDLFYLPREVFYYCLHLKLLCWKMSGIFGTCSIFPTKYRLSFNKSWFHTLWCFSTCSLILWCFVDLLFFYSRKILVTIGGKAGVCALGLVVVGGPTLSWNFSKDCLIFPYYISCFRVLISNPLAMSLVGVINVYETEIFS